MKYIAALDYEHLDNGVFLTTLARSLAEQQENENIRSIILHSDSEYTERIMQTGVMRDEARIRSIKDLNNRLVALFADQGVSTVGINPHKRKCISMENNELQIDTRFFETLPSRSVLLLSNLVFDKNSEEATVVDIKRLFSFLKEKLDADELFIFNKSDEAEIFTKSDKIKSMKWDQLEPAYKTRQIPDEFENLSMSVRMTTARDFRQLPDLGNTILIETSSE